MKLAFVNQRYGLKVNGGSEYYTRMMAEHLAKQDGIEVEVLTTKAMDHNTWENVYTQDVEQINGITVRRFSVKHPKKDLSFRIADKLRRMNIKPKSVIEKNWIVKQGPYAPDLIHYIKQHKEDYDVFVFVTYLYYPTVFGLPEVSDKAILIPTAHDEPYIYMDIMKKVFCSPKAIFYLTEEEKQLVERTFHNQKIPSDVIGTGISYESGDIRQDEMQQFKEKYQIDDEYLIYAGRIDEAKGCKEMFDFFLKNKKNHPDLKLVAMGQAGMEIPNDEAIVKTGFVEEREKQVAIAGAKALIMPSAYESLSIAVLEAMAMGVPVIVNGNSPVLKGHVERSKGGYYYRDYEEFCVAVDKLWKENYLQLSQNAEDYVRKNYTWSEVLKRFLRIASIANE